MKIDIPCKVGDTVWGICHKGARGGKGGFVASGKVREMYFADTDMRLAIWVKNVCIGEWGRNVFATEQEARRALGKLRLGGEPT